MVGIHFLFPQEQLTVAAWKKMPQNGSRPRSASNWTWHERFYIIWKQLDYGSGVPSGVPLGVPSFEPSLVILLEKKSAQLVKHRNKPCVHCRWWVASFFLELLRRNWGTKAILYAAYVSPHVFQHKAKYDGINGRCQVQGWKLQYVKNIVLTLNSVVKF